MSSKAFYNERRKRKKEIPNKDRDKKREKGHT
jgi:hypothetical protein